MSGYQAKQIPDPSERETHTVTTKQDETEQALAQPQRRLAD